MLFHGTNNPSDKVNFETALLRGMGSGLYMMARSEVPKFSTEEINSMKGMSYAEIAFKVLRPYIEDVIETDELKELLDDAYSEESIPTRVESLTGKTHIMWLTDGPTYSFKDYAARFFGRTLSYFLKKRAEKRIVIVATSGDTGGAVADALSGLENISNVVFYPKGSISERQRRQMTTLQGNVHAFEVNGDFDVCQALAKFLLVNKTFAEEDMKNRNIFTSANSISLGRLLPQSVYPFYAYSKIGNGEEMTASIPSGNFGDMMGTVLAKEMGLPIGKIVIGVNENIEFPEFLETGEYTVRESVKGPSSAMIVSHPSNLARLIDFYGGHMYDKRDPETNRVVKRGVIDKEADMESMRKDIYSTSVGNDDHYTAMKEAYEKYGVILDPHGAVGYRALDRFLEGKHDKLSVIYETADPGKFPEDVVKAIGKTPSVPARIQEQEKLDERTYSIESSPLKTENGLKLSDEQIKEAKEKIKKIFL